MSLYRRTLPWTADEDRQLRLLWNAGWSVIAIGITIGRSKNAVCGRRARLGLPERGNPATTKICPDKIARFRREMSLALDAARDELERLAA